jgi:hypothetical protein
VFARWGEREAHPLARVDHSFALFALVGGLATRFRVTGRT